MVLSILLAGTMAFQKPQNFVVIFVDDMGYGDLSCYGNTRYKTPNLDRMAANGAKFTNFYVGSPACSPSRASLLTGCYPTRVSVPQVLGPDWKTGLNPDEITIPRMLKASGYATACVGKWHLGVKNLMPTHQGFDEFFGLPYSADMWPPNGNWPRLFLYEGDKPLEEIKNLDDQAQLTRRYTEHAQEFIRKNKKKPFFLYMTHSMPHVPIAASKRFLGKSRAGLYGDVVQEIDWSVGEVLKTLKEQGLEKNTLVTFSSDNGPWLPYGDHAGSAGGLREGKGTTFEGGFREPGIFYEPGFVPKGLVVNEMASTMDYLPTFAKLSGATLPKNEIDGHDIRDLITGKKGAKTPWDAFYYYWPGELQAVRSGDWKLHVPHNHRHQTYPAGTGGKPAGEVTEHIGLSLFNITKDPAETTNVADQHPEIVERLLKLIEEARQDFGDTLTKRVGSKVRPPGKVDPTG
ncbi:MAG: sulfatase-like hydrolase/transferase [Armatimonadetes bacterium]|nr:sulfatase-like hydrolase/transferase [Armatimonadota bacterium]